ncbi:MAG: methyl-accepting chemotaxis protein [Treponema sp.]|nr:methyl-accepting chemotaxis protein [Treponema sp.]
MKVRLKIIGSLGLMIFVVSCILVLFIVLSAGGIRQRGNAMLSGITKDTEENVRKELLALADNISNYVLSLEGEIDQSMRNAANVLYEVDRMSGGKLTLAELERLKKETGMSDLYLAGMDGVFTLSTEPGAAGISLFDIWDGYKMLVTGKSDHLPSDMKIKVETGEIFKFTAIPRSDKRGILESALNANAIEEHLQNFITTKGIKSMNLFDFTLLTLTANKAKDATPVYTKGKTVPAGTAEVADLFKDATKIQLKMDQQNARIYYPVKDGSRVRYVLFIDMDTSSYFAASHQIENSISALVQASSSLNVVSLAVVFAVLLLFTVFITIMVSQLLKPLGFFNNALASFSEGNLALTLPEDFTKRKDEMGDISRSFGNALVKLRHLITMIRDQSLSLQTIGEELTSQMAQTSQAVEGISGSIQRMTNQTGKQATGVSETGNSVSQIMETMNELNKQIAVQFDHVSRSSEVIEGLLKNIHQVVETLTGNSQNVAVLTKSSEVGRRDLQKVSEDIQAIAKESEGILQINSVMENIASQTNLLSMNAAIEAAHAGEAGRGFAVVAGEIRKLAESSGRQSKTTAEMLKRIKKSIDAITESMKVVFANFESIEREVQTVSKQEESIHTMMTEQEESSHHVLEVVSRLNSITGKVKEDSENIAGKSGQVLQESANLKSITAEIAGDMNDIVQGAEQINNAVVRVNEISGENKRNIDTLTVEVSKFKV